MKRSRDIARINIMIKNIDFCLDKINYQNN